jgi:hypothetical protein
MEDKQPGELAVLTIEEESLFEEAYPEVVAVYQKQKLEIKGKKQKSKYWIGYLYVPHTNVIDAPPVLFESILSKFY